MKVVSRYVFRDQLAAIEGREVPDHLAPWRRRTRKAEADAEPATPPLLENPS